jgi:hypothetical protein
VAILSLPPRMFTNSCILFSEGDGCDDENYVVPKREHVATYCRVFYSTEESGLAGIPCIVTFRRRQRRLSRFYWSGTFVQSAPALSRSPPPMGRAGVPRAMLDDIGFIVANVFWVAMYASRPSTISPCGFCRH